MANLGRDFYRGQAAVLELVGLPRVLISGKGRTLVRASEKAPSRRDLHRAVVRVRRLRRGVS